jgi:hypothetical protein
MKIIRQFHRRVNYTSTSVNRVKCEHSVAHSLRIAPPTCEQKAEALEWNSTLQNNNLILMDGKISRLDDWSPASRLELLYQIAPQPKIRNQTPLQEQQRKYRLKIKKAIDSERDNGNVKAAEFLEQILAAKEYVPYSKIDQFAKLTMQRKSQRLNMLKTYLNAHNQLQNRPCANAVYLQEGIFKIPHQWDISQKTLSLEEYMRFAEQFLKAHFPEYPIQAIVGHDDERSLEQQTGHHPHYFLSGKNAETGEYNLHKRQIKVVNAFIQKNYPSDELLPDNGKLTLKQSKVFGEYFQRMARDYANEHLFHPKALHIELSPEAERKSEKRKQINREAKLAKWHREYNYQTHQLALVQQEIANAKTHLETFEDAGNAAQLKLMNLNADVTAKQKEITQLQERQSELKSELTTLYQEKFQLLALTKELTADVGKKLVTVFRQVVLALNARDKNLEQKFSSYLLKISESALQLPPSLSDMLVKEVKKMELPDKPKGYDYD